MQGRFKGFDWGITTRLVVQVYPSGWKLYPSGWKLYPSGWWLYPMQQTKFKAPQSIIKKCVNTQVNICEQQLGTMDCFVEWHQKLQEIQASYITLHALVEYHCYLHSASALCNITMISHSYSVHDITYTYTLYILINYTLYTLCMYYIATYIWLNSQIAFLPE